MNLVKFRKKTNFIYSDLESLSQIKALKLYFISDSLIN